MSLRDPNSDEHLRIALLAAPERDTVGVVRRLVSDLEIEAGLDSSAVEVCCDPNCHG